MGYQKRGAWGHGSPGPPGPPKTATEWNFSETLQADSLYWEIFEVLDQGYISEKVKKLLATHT